MAALSHSELVVMFLSLAVLLALARLLGEIAQHLGQPSVLGEILAGILLGPTVFGAISPEWFHALFPATGNPPLVLDGLTNLAITLFLLVAGLEVDLSTVWRQGRTALTVGMTSVVLPFGVGFGVGYAAPALMGFEPGADRLIFALFIATALSISALPIIAKTLMDLNLYRSDFGMLVVAAAVLNDIVGWLVFAVILGMLAEGTKPLSPGAAIALTLGFTVFMLTAVRWLINRSLPWLQARSSWPGGVLGFALSITLFAAAFTEWIGVHAIFGAFLAGVALGDSQHLRARTRATIEQFVSFIFAPLFFASIGLKVDFFASFDPVLVAVVFVIATIGKLAGCLMGGKLSGLSSRESWGVGVAMNARGAMEIILGLLALQYGLISEPLFVALVIMALGTAVLSGPLLHRILQLEGARHFSEFLHAGAFIPEIRATRRDEGIAELAAAAARVAEIDPDTLTLSACAREGLRSTGLAGGLAIPNALVSGIEQPLIALGFSRAGLDFDAPDGERSHVIALLVVPNKTPEVQLELVADLGHSFRDPTLLADIEGVHSFTELLAKLRLHGLEGHGEPAEPRRSGAIVVSARPLGRAIAAQLRDAGWSVRLIDSSKLSCDAATHEGFEAIAGNALEEATLFQAQAFSAQALIALTPNSAINLRAARLARTRFGVAECFALAPRELRIPDEELQGISIIPLPAGTLSIEEWDIALSRERAQWVTVPEEVGKEDRPHSMPEGSWNGMPVLVALAESAEGELSPVGIPHESAPGERYRALKLMEEEGERDRIDMLLESAPLLDFPEAMDFEAFTREAASALAARLPLDEAAIGEQLRSREHLSTTILEPGLAVPHLIIEGEGHFELIIVRCIKGIRFAADTPPVQTAFVSAASADQRNLHLRMLSAVVQIVRSNLFESSWLEAEDPKRLREILLYAGRKRDFKPGSDVL